MPNSIETTGIDELFSEMRRQYGSGASIAACVRMSTTEPENIPKKDSKTTDRLLADRTPGKNMMILNILAKAKRRFDFVDDSTKNVILDSWYAAVDKYLSKDSGALISGAKRVAELLVIGFRDHFRRGEAKDGQPKPLDPKYKAIKKNIFGKELPIGVSTGRTKNSFTTSVEIIR